MVDKSPQTAGFFQSVFSKCLLNIACTAVVVVAAISFSNYLNTAAITRDILSNLSVSGTRATALALATQLTEENDSGIENVIADMKAQSGGYTDNVLIFDSAATVRYQSTNMNAEERATLEGLAQDALSSGSMVQIAPQLDIAVPIVDETGALLGALAVDWSSATLFAQVRQQAAVGLLYAGLMLVAALIASTYLLRQIIGKPLKHLTASIQRVSDGDYESEVLGVDRKDEFGLLAQRLHSLRERLANGKAESEEAASRREGQRELIAALRNALRKLSDGDLLVTLDRNVDAEYAELVHDFNDSTGSVHDTVSGVVTLADKIRHETNEIGRYANDLSSRTENQAATLEETAAALDDLTNGVRHAAESTKEVANIVQRAQQEATNSGEVVQKTISAMSEISESSNQISAIIAVIDDIAFQTNLLALNAGVEAARAGDAGRGFAVVASEVRALAQRSSEAASEIKTLIGDSSEHVANGVSLVAQAGDALTAITERVVQVSSLVTEMAGNAQDQAASLDEINVGVGQLDQVTQRNASMVEESNSATKSLLAQAESLNNLVGDFKVNSSKANTTLLLEDRVA